MGDELTSDELRRWFDALRDHDQAVRSRFVRDSADANTRRLSQQTVHKQVTVAAETFWTQNDANRLSLRPSFWSTLCTLKVLADDTFVEALEVANAANDATAFDAARTEYRETLLAFVAANPYAFASPADRADWHSRMFREHRPFEHLTGADTIEGFEAWQPNIDDRRYILGKLVSVARAAQDKLRTAATTAAKAITVPVEARPVIGSLFVLLQLFLTDLRDRGGPPTFPGDHWYPFAAAAIDELRTTVLGFFWTVEREMRDKGLTDVADALRELGETHIDMLARLFSVRAFETAGAWAFRNRRLLKKTGEVFREERIVVGSNLEKQTLMSYLGRPNPDGSNDLGVLSVEGLLDHAAAFEGRNDVRVFGDVVGTRLVSLTTNQSVDVDFERRELRSAQALGVAVEIDGRFTRASGIEATAVRRFAEGYDCAVGFPLAVGEIGQEVPLSIDQPPSVVPLDLQPSRWRPQTSAELAESTREDHYHVPTAIVGQQRLLRDLLASSAVRTALGKRATTIQVNDLHDAALRGDIWNALFSELEKADPKTSFDRLLALQQRYATHFTRHTLWNVHDDDPSYFKTKWPLTIDGRALYDCGVYCVLTAMDLKRAVEGTGKLLTFGFVTFLNHIALVIYQDDRSAFVNNDLIHGPRQMTRDDNKDSTARAVFAGRVWARRGFALVYRVDYSVALIRVPEETISSSLASPMFEKKLWKFYKATAVWWGLKPGIAGTYHDDLAAFNRRMVALETALAALKKDTPASQLIDVSTETAALYALAEQLASPSNFGERSGVKKTVKEVSAIGVISPFGKPLPLYDVVERLKLRSKLGDTLTTDQTTLVNMPATLQDHADQLNAMARAKAP